MWNNENILFLDSVLPLSDLFDQYNVSKDFLTDCKKYFTSNETTMVVDFDKRIKDEWRELGFYYELEESSNKNEWKFYGSKDGLQNFVKILECYTNNSGNDLISEHDIMDLIAF